jgi:hypothetical protein
MEPEYPCRAVERPCPWPLVIGPIMLAALIWVCSLLGRIAP